jgi:hypothetical protein
LGSCFLQSCLQELLVLLEGGREGGKEGGRGEWGGKQVWEDEGREGWRE